MSLDDQLWADEVFEQVKKVLSGKQFERLPWYNPSGKVFMLVSAGDGAVVLNDLFACMRDNAGKLLHGLAKEKEEASEKIMQAVAAYLAPPKG